MTTSQPSFADIEYANRRKTTRRDKFLALMDQAVPWEQWLAVIEPFYYHNTNGRPAVRLETILRFYLVQCWFNLSDEAAEDAVYDSWAVRQFMRIDFAREQAPDATTLLKFRHLLEAHRLGEALLEAQKRLFEQRGWVMRGGSIVDATIIGAPTSVKNKDKARDPEACQTRKGQQWYFGFKAHIGVGPDGYAHTVVTTAANTSDVEVAKDLVREDDRVVWADAGYQGVDKRPEIAGDPVLSQVEFRVAARKSKLKDMPVFDQRVQSRQASVRAKVEHVFLVFKRDFGFAKTRYRGIAKNHNRLVVLAASANLLMRGRAERIMGFTG